MRAALARAASWLLALSFGPASALADIVVLRSATTETQFRAQGADYEKLVAEWRSFARRHALRTVELEAGELARIKQPRVLVLAATAGLSKGEREAVLDRVAAGWSVLGIWNIGTYDDAGKWQGYGLVEELFAARVMAEQVPGAGEGFFLPFGETPMTHAVAAGTRMYLKPTTEQFLRMKASRGAGRLTSYIRDVSEPGSMLSAAAYDERDGARRAYFGIAPTSWDSARAEVDRMLLGTLDWLQRRPIVVKAAWPHPHQAAVLLTMDTEDRFENAQIFAEQLEQHRMAATFYALTSEAVRHPGLVKRLYERHEIAYHGDVHDTFAKVDRQRQASRLAAMLRQMARIFGGPHRATGFRPPYEEYDDNTVKLLYSYGLRHIAGSVDSRPDALPGFSPLDSNIVVLARTWLDDVHLQRRGMLEARRAERVLLESLADTLATRGLGFLSLHSQNYGPKSVLEAAMPALFAALQKEGEAVWVTTASALDRWWRDRESVKVTVREQRRAARVKVEGGRRRVQKLCLIVFPPADSVKLEAGSLKARLHKLDAFRWAVVIDELRAGETGELALRF